VKEGFLKEYLEIDQEELKGAISLRDQVHEILIHGELNTISGGFLEEGALLPSISDTREQ